MKNEKKNKTGSAAYVKTLLAMYIVTGLLLFVVAFITSKSETEESVAKIGIIVIYLLSTLVGGIIIGKIKKQKKLLWGLLMGAAYFMVLFAISVGMGRESDMDVVHIATSLCLCLFGGGIGGMIS